MNNVSFVGRLTADPDEPATTRSGKKVLDLRVAINHYRRAASTADTDQGSAGDEGAKRERGVTFVTVRCWNATAENVRQYLEKGALVGVSGSLDSDEWQDQTTGEKRHKVYVTARSIDFLERRIAQAALSAANDSLGAGVEPF
jgi:single-strand DNA-binding protein